MTIVNFTINISCLNLRSITGFCTSFLISTGNCSQPLAKMHIFGGCGPRGAGCMLEKYFVIPPGSRIGSESSEADAVISFLVIGQYQFYIRNRSSCNQHLQRRLNLLILKFFAHPASSKICFVTNCKFSLGSYCEIFMYRSTKQ